jgi:hypothetical protein
MKILKEKSLCISFFAEPKKTVDKLLAVNELFINLIGNLDIENYSQSINYLAVYFFILNPKAIPQSDKITVRKKQQLEIRINADYDRILKADERETLQIIAETYLKAIEIFLIPRKDFESKKFYEDVKSLFEKEGILEKIE